MAVVRFFSADEEYGELSNFYILENPIVFEGRKYISTEHLFQAMKYIIQPQTEALSSYISEIAKCSSPYKSKILGGMTHSHRKWAQELSQIITTHQNQGVKIHPNWNNIRRDAMRLILWVKFETNPKCRRVLTSSHFDSELIESSPYDSYWGCGRDGKGMNWLGRTLMEIREAIRQGLEVDSMRDLEFWVKQQREK